MSTNSQNNCRRISFLFKVNTSVNNGIVVCGCHMGEEGGGMINEFVHKNVHNLISHLGKQCGSNALKVPSRLYCLYIGDG